MGVLLLSVCMGSLLGVVLLSVYTLVCGELTRCCFTVLQCPVGDYSKCQSLPVHHWPLPTMHGRYDVGVIVSFGHMIPKRIIKMFP